MGSLLGRCGGEIGPLLLQAEDSVARGDMSRRRRCHYWLTGGDRNFAKSSRIIASLHLPLADPPEKPPPSGQPVQQSSVHTGVPELRAKVQPRRAVALHATTRP